MVRTTQQQRQTGSRQHGGRVLVFRGAPLQRGHGLGGLFKTLFRVAIPAIRRAAPIVKHAAVRVGKAATKRAVKAGTQVFIAAAEAINNEVMPQRSNTPKRKLKSKQQKRRKTNAPRL